MLFFVWEDASFWAHRIHSFHVHLSCLGPNPAWTIKITFLIPQFSSVAQSCPALCDSMNCSMPGLPVHHQFLEFTKTHIHRVSDAIQPSHPLSSPSPPAPNPSQHQSLPVSQLFAWGSQSTGVSTLASLLPKNTQDWSPLLFPNISCTISSKYCFTAFYKL